MKKSAGILLYRVNNKNIEVLLVHPGGPFWKNKDEGAWSIPKGEFNEEESGLDTAIREFEEELGTKPSGEFIELHPVKQLAGKVVYAWALKGDLDTGTIKSNSVSIEWPPRSGKKISFPEIDKAQWFTATAAKEKINPAQLAFLKDLQNKLRRGQLAAPPGRTGKAGDSSRVEHE